MELIMNMLFGLELLFVAYFGYAAIYFLVFGAASHFYKPKARAPIGAKKRVAVLVPAYKEDAVIAQTARAAMAHSSSFALLEIFVIADSLQPHTHQQIRETGAGLLTVNFEKSTKAKAINYALEQLSNNYDYVVVLDADNIMAPGFIDLSLMQLTSRSPIVQGHRTAKNSNTQFAVLDGLSEEINNSIFRKGHRALGFSAALIGSGFICSYTLFKQQMARINAVGGFDKELELLLLDAGYRIAYAPNALVYDEKVQKPQAFVNQRRRWLSAQFIFFGRNAGKGIYKLLRNGNLDYFNKVQQYMLPPRIISLGFTFVMAVVQTAVHYLTGAALSTPFVALWALWFALSSLAIILSIPTKHYGRKTLRALAALPKGFVLTIWALLRTKHANKSFLHTQHGVSN